MSLLSEFKTFAVKGNALDLAVGVIIGGAFGKIVTSIVNDIIMPPIGLLLGGLDFKEWNVVLKQAVVDDAGKQTVAPVMLNIGNFISTTVDFLIIAVVIFLMIKGINSLKTKKEEAPAAPAEPSSTDKLLIEIRDELKKK